MEAGEATNLPSFSSLPCEVIFNVLKNLPAKTLLKCRCVCKDWNSIITNQSFVNAHLLSQPDGHLFFHSPEPRHQPSSATSVKTQLCSFFPDESFSLLHKFKVSLPYSSQQEPFWNLVGSMNGLLCLTDSKPYGHKLYLWNPTIRKYKTLSNTCFKGKHHQRYFHKAGFILGLGFRARTNDYIIIRIALLKWQSRPSPKAEAYSLSTDSWKRVGFPEDISRRFIGIVSFYYVHVNGDLNWMARFFDREGQLYESILSFDINKEEFKEIKLPSNGIVSFHPDIAIHRGLLAVIDSGYPIPKDGNKYIWLWTMEDYGKVDSWRRTAKVKATGWGAFLLCTSDGRIMFRKRGGAGEIVEVLDMETLQEQRFSIPYFVIAYSFKETLVSLEGANVSCE